MELEFLAELRAFACKNSTEAAVKTRLLQFLETHGEGAFGREIAGEGHVVSVARIENRAKNKVLLVFGAKENRWKMPDSHLETEPLQAAREIAARVLGHSNFAGGALISLAQRVVEPYWNTPSHHHFELIFGFVANEIDELPRGAQWFARVNRGYIRRKTIHSRHLFGNASNLNEEFSMSTTQINVAAGGTFALGGDLTVNRLGYGAMQITGKGVWGQPNDPAEAIRVLKRAVEMGVNLIDTANSYGPYVSEELIREALHPYAEGLVIATKGGLTRTGPNQWHPVGRPEYLRQEVEMSLRRLDLERIDLWQLHRIDPKTPREEQFQLLADVVKEGKVRHVGLSEVSVEEIEAARQFVPIVSVQNKYNLSDRSSEEVLEYCERENIGFIPWFPLNTGNLAKTGAELDHIAHNHSATPAQIALAWLLKRSPVMLPIPGTSSVGHLEENLGAVSIELSDEEFEELKNLA